MEYYEISVPDRNDSVMRVNLDGTYYYLELLLSQLERPAGNPWRSNGQGTHREAGFC